MLLSEIHEIAVAARMRFEFKQVPAGELRPLYQEYNPIPHLTTFLQRAKNLFPQLNCGLASVYLKHMLGYGEVVQGKYLGHGHTFLLLPGEVVVDITADQFGGPAIYVGPLQEPWMAKGSSINEEAYGYKEVVDSEKTLEGNRTSHSGG